MAIFQNTLNDVIGRSVIASPAVLAVGATSSVMLAVAGALAVHTGVFAAIDVAIYLAHMVANGFMVAAGVVVIAFLVVASFKSRPGESFFADLRDRVSHSDRRRLVEATLVLGSVLSAHAAYSLVKRLLPMGQGFPMDEALADLDRWLHGGVDPWLPLHQLLPTGPWNALIELNYMAGWGSYMLGILIWIAVSPAFDRNRARLLLIYLGLLVGVGNLLAYLGLSGGPIFYDRITGDAVRFAGLSAYIESGAGGLLPVVEVRDFLWKAYLAGTPEFGTGISAFPSVHVATSTFAYLVIRSQSRAWSWAALGYLALIQFCSVYLGWHYALDGYASMIVVALAWWAVHRFLPDDRLRRPGVAPRP